MFSKLSEIESFHSLEHISSGLFQIQFGLHNKELFRDVSTSDIPEGMSRSKKTQGPSLDISFQKDFMKEHEQAVKNSLKEYVNSLEIFCGQKFLLQSPFIEIINLNQQETNNFLDVLNASTILDTNQKKQFLLDLKGQDLLKNFVDMLCVIIKKEFAEELIGLVFYCWEEYLKIRHNITLATDQQVLIQYANAYAQNSFKEFYRNHKFQKIFYRYKLNQQNLKDQFNSQLIEQSFKHFLSCLSQTVMLIIEGYFQNPNSISEMKRQHEEIVFSNSSIDLRNVPKKKNKIL